MSQKKKVWELHWSATQLMEGSNKLEMVSKVDVRGEGSQGRTELTEKLDYEPQDFKNRMEKQ